MQRLRLKCNLGGHPLTPFNRAKLLNVGFKIASAGDFDCFFFSDIDLFRVLKVMFPIIANFQKVSQLSLFYRQHVDKHQLATVW